MKGARETATPPATSPVSVRIDDSVVLEGDRGLPEGTRSVVIFAHGSGSSRHSPRNRFVASRLLAKGIGTLLFDLLTEREDRDPRARFDIDLLTRRLEDVTRGVGRDPETADLAVGYFGASTGAAAALKAAADLGGAVRAVVSRGGRPDLAGDALPGVEAPTLLIDDSEGSLRRSSPHSSRSHGCGGVGS